MAAPQVREGFCGTVGHTPLVRLPRLSALTGCDILAKAEHMNPGEDAERRGALRPGGTVIESTAGNTGIGLVLVANAKGYKTKFFVPDSTSSEKINVLRRLGAEVIICPSVSYDNPAHFQTAARLCAEQTENSYFTKQFWNEANYQAHYDTTGPEIWHQTNGKVSAFVCAAGTGGTIGGTSNFLKDKSGGKVKCFLMDPSATGVKYHTEGDKIVLSEKTADEKALDKSSVLEGIGSSKLYLPLSKSRLDGVLTAPDSLAFEMANWLLKHEGISVGPSAALNVLAALWVASGLGRGHTVVTILCDIGSNYYSRDAAWLESKGIAVQPQVSAEQFLAAFNPTRVKVSHVPLAYPHAHP